MRTTPTCTCHSADLITSTLVINFWLDDVNTHVLSPVMYVHSRECSKPGIISTEVEPNIAVK
jgi:hypothetical protein